MTGSTNLVPSRHIRLRGRPQPRSVSSPEAELRGTLRNGINARQTPLRIMAVLEEYEVGDEIIEATLLLGQSRRATSPAEPSSERNQLGPGCDADLRCVLRLRLPVSDSLVDAN